MPTSITDKGYKMIEERPTTLKYCCYGMDSALQDDYTQKGLTILVYMDAKEDKSYLNRKVFYNRANPDPDIKPHLINVSFCPFCGKDLVHNNILERLLNEPA